MSITQQILQLLRTSECAMTGNQIRDALGIKPKTPEADSISTRMKDLIKSGVVEVGHPAEGARTWRAIPGAISAGERKKLTVPQKSESETPLPDKPPSVTQQVRDALRSIGGPATALEIRERIESDVNAIDVGTRLKDGERGGWISVDRDSRPFTYTLVSDPPPQRPIVASINPTSHLQHTSAVTEQEPPRDKPTPTATAPKLAAIRPAKATQVAADIAVDTITIARSELLQLCAMAISQAEPSRQQCLHVANLLLRAVQ